MPLKIIRNDITRVAADAIVNTANPLPRVGDGTDRAIHEAAGPELLEARKRIGEIPVGKCAVTPAFLLPASYVLHTVSPRWEGGGHREAALLRAAYDAALAQAARLNCRCVSFPLMAAGSYGFPKDLALSIAIQAFTDFLMEHDVTIFLVLFNGEAFGLAASLFDDLKSYIDDNYAAESRAKERRRDRPQPPMSGQSATRWEEYEDIASALEADDSVCCDMESLPAPPTFHAPPCANAPAFSLPGAGKAGKAAGREQRRPAAPSAPAPAMAESLGELLRQSESTFSEFLLDLLRERTGKDSEVYKRAEISKQLFSRILSTKDYQPTKSTAIQLAIGLQLDLRQTQKLLEKAGFTLTRSSKADLVVQYYIERNVYSVTFINEALSDCGLPLLKTGLKA